ncbi:MAG: 50S ribosomal protein L14e [Nanoarchaeota archaeon]|nr:50S ribosomal protein L14e [bacterium]MBU3958089.1 50S ribosomal protein L14e [Nanoarchaeota archaeon]
MIFEPGRVCVKIAGREAGNHCAVLEVIDANYVMVEGPQVRKRKTNVAHLEPLADKIDSKKDAKQQLAEKYGIKLPEKRKAEKAAKTEKPVKASGAVKEKKKQDKK